jgi:molybdate transport system ATP-binding protein
LSADYKFHFQFIVPVGGLSLKVDVKSHSRYIALKAPSGSGKSSFLRALLGHNKNVTGMNLPRLNNIGYVPQDSLLIPHLSIRENLLLSPRSNSNELEDVVKNLQIGHLLERFPRLLSGGEKQRVAIGRALLSNPEVLLLDEPFSALDKTMRLKILEYLKNWLAKKNVDLILVAHDEDTALSLCEETWAIHGNLLSVEVAGNAVR